MTSEQFQAYLNRLGRELRKRGLVDPRIVEEARDHLVDAIEHGLQRGLSADAAEREAFARFGAPETLAKQFAAERYRTLNRWLFVGASVVGLIIAYVDSQPTWDGAGITAFAMLLAAGVLGMMGPHRPWLWALAIGMWVPLYTFAHTASVRSLGTLVVLAFPLAGAYAGRALRYWGMAVRRLRGEGWHLSEHSDVSGRTVWHLTQGTSSIARRIASIYRPDISDRGHTGIADADANATERVRQVIVAAARGTLNPALIAPAARDELVPALELFGPRKLDPMGALELLTVLEDKIYASTHVRRYRAAFALGDTLILTVVHASDGAVLFLPRIDSADHATLGAIPLTKHEIFWLPPGIFPRAARKTTASQVSASWKVSLPSSASGPQRRAHRRQR